MRRPQSPTLLSLLAVILSPTHTTNAKPFPRDETIENQNSTLVERQCAFPCGLSATPICCQAAGQCYTDGNNQAQCGSGGIQQANSGNNGQWQIYTTTYTTEGLITVTSTYSVQSATVQVAPAATPFCDTSMGESPCGNICCATGQQCQWQGSCIASGPTDVSSSYLASVMSTSAGGSAYIRPTSDTTQTVTSTGSATTTVPIQSAVPSASSGTSTAGMESTTSNNGLTGGQIAGIVIGVLLGILLLLIICGCLCFKGLLDQLLAIFGLGPRARRRKEVITEERYSHHHSGTGGGAGGRRWFGQSGPSRPQREKQSSGLGGIAGVGAGLGALALLLGLKRRRDRRDKESYGTASMYTYSDYTSSSEYPRHYPRYSRG